MFLSFRCGNDQIRIVLRRNLLDKFCPIHLYLQFVFTRCQQLLSESPDVCNTKFIWQPTCNYHKIQRKSIQYPKDFLKFRKSNLLHSYASYSLNCFVSNRYSAKSILKGARLENVCNIMFD